MSTGYDQIYRHLLPKLSGCDLEECARRLGLQFANDCITADFLGRRYRIGHDGVRAEDGEPVHSNTCSVLLYYVLSPGAGALSHSFAPLNRLTGLIDGQNFLTRDIMDRPLIREFGSNYPAFEAAMLRLGGEMVSRRPGGYVWQLPLLPKILVQIIFYEADEEFPADIQIQFDETTPRFLEFECIAFLTGCLVKALLHS